MPDQQPPVRWSQVVTETSKSTYPPPGIFKRPKEEVAEAMAKPEISPKGPVSGIRMIQFYINRAGKNLPPERKAELSAAIVLMREQMRQQLAKKMIEEGLV